MRRTLGIVVACASSLSLVAFTATASADNGHQITHTSSQTTLDACGYFVGTQSSKEGRSSTDANGVTTSSQRGTWTGVENNYVLTPVASLGPVQGAYNETEISQPDGSFSGTEDFVSNAGKIAQTFSYSPVSGFDVQVTATRDLSFLTSDTNGQCYSGPFPRP